MEVYCGDMWDLAAGNTLVIPINRVVKPNGELVMGAGVAELAKRKHPGIELTFGMQVADGGFKYCYAPSDNTFVVGIPTKNHFKDRTTPTLFFEAIDLLKLVMYETTGGKVVCPLLGAGLGGLDTMYVFREMRKHFINTDLIIPLVRKDYERIFTGKYRIGTSVRLS